MTCFPLAPDHFLQSYRTFFVNSHTHTRERVSGRNRSVVADGIFSAIDWITREIPFCAMFPFNDIEFKQT